MIDKVLTYITAIAYRQKLFGLALGIITGAILAIVVVQGYKNSLSAILKTFE